MSTVSKRIERLEASDAFAGEPRDFAELAEWCESGRPFAIEPGSRWYALWLASLEGEQDADD